ncbi:ATP synthase F1 subunit delta [Reichenbachiella versicolor]|uniref:ATP synthase F1 subunit delta n=1 Tax=Reichenbachiella versicolor TaxID=1821036 RepID=UPI000D6EA6C4|nr:ATP synthase F1 subunit delta [Reichenbachiella versicolor]
MSEFRIASRYAKSLIELAQEQKSVDKVLADIRLLKSTCESNRDFLMVLRNPIVNSQQKLSILTKIFEGKVDNLTLEFFKILTRKRREEYLYDIAQVFEQQYNDMNGIVSASITTVSPLSTSNRKDIEALLKKLTNDAKVDLKESINPDLIGGFLLKIGDKQIDDSVSGKLRELKLQFAERSFATK